MPICPACYDGIHTKCIGQGCDCGCDFDIEQDETVTCPRCCGGIDIEGGNCEYCDGNGYLPI